MAFGGVVRVIVDRALREATAIKEIVGGLARVAVGVIEAGAAGKGASIASASNAVGISVVRTRADTARK